MSIPMISNAFETIYRKTYANDLNKIQQLVMLVTSEDRLIT